MDQQRQGHIRARHKRRPVPPDRHWQLAQASWRSVQDHGRLRRERLSRTGVCGATRTPSIRCNKCPYPHGRVPCCWAAPALARMHVYRARTAQRGCTSADQECSGPQITHSDQRRASMLPSAARCIMSHARRCCEVCSFLLVQRKPWRMIMVEMTAQDGTPVLRRVPSVFLQHPLLPGTRAMRHHPAALRHGQPAVLRRTQQSGTGACCCWG